MLGIRAKANPGRLTFIKLFILELQVLNFNNQRVYRIVNAKNAGESISIPTNPIRFGPTACRCFLWDSLSLPLTHFLNSNSMLNVFLIYFVQECQVHGLKQKNYYKDNIFRYLFDFRQCCSLHRLLEMLQMLLPSSWHSPELGDGLKSSIIAHLCSLAGILWQILVPRMCHRVFSYQSIQ